MSAAATNTWNRDRISSLALLKTVRADLMPSARRANFIYCTYAYKEQILELHEANNIKITIQ
jgi:hypothetical protein